MMSLNESILLLHGLCFKDVTMMNVLLQDITYRCFCKQNSSSAHLVVCSPNNLRTYTLLIKYLTVCPPESGSLETEIQKSESNRSAR